MEAIPCTQPKEVLHILFAEDNDDDLELMLRTLERAGLNVLPAVVKTESEFIDQLLKGHHDAVVSDYRLNGWTGMDALRVLHNLKKQIPFILVTGFLGEELAVDCVRQGVSDYILKDRMTRLPISICRSVNEMALSCERGQAISKARDTETMFHTLAESIDSALFVYVGSKCQYANREAENITGYSRGELLAMSSLELIHQESRESVIQLGFRTVGSETAEHNCEAKITTKAGEAKWLKMSSRVIEIEGKLGRVVMAHDITQMKATDEESRRLASIDPLTGLANYRRLTDVFDSENARAQRTGRPFSMMLMDLDKLKAINDLYGHEIGSRALCRVGRVLQTQCRSVDLAARYGGDEFMLIMPETPIAAARHVAQRIAATVKRDTEQPNISISFGLAACPDNGSTFKDVLRIADRGLYSMKGERSNVSEKNDLVKAENS